MRQVALRILQQSGYSVLAAASAEEAISLAKSNTVDLLVTDVVMPRISGPSLAATLAESRPGLRVLFLSGYGSEIMVERSEPLVDCEFLQKPFGALELLDAVRRVLDK